MAAAPQMIEERAPRLEVAAPPPKDDTDYVRPWSPLTERECDDLRWYWRKRESDYGVGSTAGAQLERAYAQWISDEAVREERARKFKLRLELHAQRHKRATVPKRKASDIDREIRQEWIHLHSPPATTPDDPFPSDDIFKLLRVSKRVERRLLRVGDSHTRVLYAAFGETQGGWPSARGGWPHGEEDNPHTTKATNAKKRAPVFSPRAAAARVFDPMLVEIVASIVAFEMYREPTEPNVRLVKQHDQDDGVGSRERFVYLDEDPARGNPAAVQAIARELVVARVNDKPFVERLKKSAARLLYRAARAYAGVR